MKYRIDWDSYERSSYFCPVLTPYVLVTIDYLYQDDLGITIASVSQRTRLGRVRGATVPLDLLEEAE